MNFQRGVALYLALAILAILLGIALGVAGIMLGELKTIQDIGFSTVAFYAADSGIEWELLGQKYSGQPQGYTFGCFIDLDDPNQEMSLSCDPTQSCPDNLSSNPGADACIQITLVSALAPTTIHSVGYYNKVRRALEISF